jgi:riboflavin kinase / FMN adenylyltransferase
VRARTRHQGLDVGVGALRAPVLVGLVEHGDARGRELGFPTANLAPDAIGTFPPEGVYAAWCRRADGTCHASAVSVGRRPTFYRDEEDSLLVEAYLLDFSGDLYDERITLEFVRRLRGQVKFDSVDGLIRQMHDDVHTCRRLLLEAGPPGSG